jgi:hypothetical protein
VPAKQALDVPWLLIRHKPEIELCHSSCGDDRFGSVALVTANYPVD